MKTFSGSSALVIGGSSGIGREAVLALSKEGAKVWAVARDAARLETLRNEAAGGRNRDAGRRRDGYRGARPASRRSGARARRFERGRHAARRAGVRVHVGELFGAVEHGFEDGVRPRPDGAPPAPPSRERGRVRVERSRARRLAAVRWLRGREADADVSRELPPGRLRRRKARHSLRCARAEAAHRGHAHRGARVTERTRSAPASARNNTWSASAPRSARTTWRAPCSTLRAASSARAPRC